MAKNAILVINAGSSSLKFALFKLDGQRLELWVKGQLSEIGHAARFRIASSIQKSALFDQRYEAGEIASHHQALREVLRWISAQSEKLQLIAAGHRVVHGGRLFNQPQRVTADLLEQLDTLSPLAPHHQPHNLNAIRALHQLFPELPQVACFDTAFHAEQPEVAKLLQLPADLGDPNLRKYGFHGLSYESILAQLPDHCEGRIPQRTLIAHLGNGASLAAIRDGRSFATSMGFSTLDGLLMGSRCGTIDPGVLLYLMREHGLEEPQLNDLLYNRSGLLGVSGIGANMQELLENDAPGARRAVALYHHFLIRQIGAFTALLQGLDTLVFTGGVGENAAQIRAHTLQQLAWLGVEIDPAANARHGPQISGPNSAVRCLVLPCDEEGTIARSTLRSLSATDGAVLSSTSDSARAL